MISERYARRARLGFIADANALDALCNPAAVAALEAEGDVVGNAETAAISWTVTA